MQKKTNQKKIVGVCPVKVHRTKCPSIKRTRQIRTKLLAVQREKNIDAEKIAKLQSALKERKKRGIAVDCEACSHNKAVTA